jgi:hypothetical protein
MTLLLICTKCLNVKTNLIISKNLRIWEILNIRLTAWAGIFVFIFLKYIPNKFT